MSTHELAVKLKALRPEQRQLVESLINLFADGPAATELRDLTNHPSFGAWAGRKDMPADSITAERDLRKRAGRRSA